MSGKPFNIKKVAIIGGGPGGLVTLNELLHTGKDGRSTITSATVNNPFPSKPAFESVTVFEQNDRLGGVWNYSKQPDPGFPKEAVQYSTPEGIRTTLELPTSDQLSHSDVDHPIVKEFPKDQANYLWKHSGLYDHLFTNIPNSLMRFSSGYDVTVANPDPKSSTYTPFVTHGDVEIYLENFAKKAGLNKYIRYNSTVEKVYKKDGKWQVVISEIDHNKLKWYLESFDAVVVATGRFNIPFYPLIQGLPEYAKAHPGVVIHAKAFRNVDSNYDKKVLLVGSSVSAVDLLQYLIPKCEKVYLSSNVARLGSTEQTGTSWTDQVLRDPNLKIIRRPRIESFEGDQVKFTDGTIESGFDKIILATGYHIYYPFLDIPENKGKDYISVTSGIDGVRNYARTKVDNVYLYTFSYGDPTLTHIGIAHNPLFFLACEANAIAIAGVWSNVHSLPPKAEQRAWINNRFKGKKSGFQVFDENAIRPFISKLYELSANGRYNFLPLVKKMEIDNSKKVLKVLFHKFVYGELTEDGIYGE